jgi:WD40 repeat protein
LLTGHDGLVSSGLFVNDGKFIVTGGEDGSVRLWNPKNGQCKAILTERAPASSTEETVTSLTSFGDLIAAG